MQRPSAIRPLYFLMLCLILSSLMSSVPAAAEAGKEKTHYQVLEVPQDASLKDIKKAYRRMALRHYPERSPGDDPEATEREFQEIAKAYLVLSDKDSRREYDECTDV